MLFLWTLWADLLGAEYQLPQPFSPRTSALSSPMNSLCPGPGKTQLRCSQCQARPMEAQAVVHMTLCSLLPVFTLVRQDLESFGMKELVCQRKTFCIFCKICGISKFPFKWFGSPSSFSQTPGPLPKKYFHIPPLFILWKCVCKSVSSLVDLI